jgi:hypothetical protein
MSKNTPQSTHLELTTSSRLRAWYMVQFRGYTVAQRREVPKVTRLGRLTYEYRWLLRATRARANGNASEPLS